MHINHWQIWRIWFLKIWNQQDMQAGPVCLNSILNGGGLWYQVWCWELVSEHWHSRSWRYVLWRWKVRGNWIERYVSERCLFFLLREQLISSAHCQTFIFIRKVHKSPLPQPEEIRIWLYRFLSIRLCRSFLFTYLHWLCFLPECQL